MYHHPRREKGRLRIFVAVSGGVDSAVSLAILQRQGYDVTGCFMVNWSKNVPGLTCNWTGEREDAMRVCAHLNVPFRTVNLESQYGERVFKNFLAEYRAGRTPNPDVLCNSEIKFRAFLSWALKEGADGIATGHYARIQKSNLKNHKSKKLHVLSSLRVPRYSLRAARDTAKDQSYFLYRLGQKELSHARFPIGEFTKPHVRALARRWRLPVADKKDSQGVCFVGDVALREFLKNWIPEKPGPILRLQDEGSRSSPMNMRQNVARISARRKKPGTRRRIPDVVGYVPVGTHRGVRYYTMGQRRGLGVPGGGTPLYVAAKDLRRDMLFVAPKQHPALYGRMLAIQHVHWVRGEAPKMPFMCAARIRYRQSLQHCRIMYGATRTKGKKIPPIKKPRALIVRFARAQWAPAPGQSVVFYKNNEVLGGGIIANSVL